MPGQRRPYQITLLQCETKHRLVAINGDRVNRLAFEDVKTIVSLLHYTRYIDID